MKKNQKQSVFSMSHIELNNLLKNRFLRLAVFVVGIVPLLYGALYLWAFWNPYGRLNNIPVAVVNEDIGSANGDQLISFGGNLTDALKQNPVAKWDFVSSQEANQGLQNHKYFAEVIIPSDFSSKISSASTQDPQQAKIIFKSRESNSMIGSQLTNRIASQISDNLSHEITKQYLDNIFTKMRSSAEGVNSAANGSEQLSSGLASAQEGSKQLSTGATSTYEGSLRLVTAINSVLVGSKEINSGISQSASGAESLNQGIAAAAAGSKNLASGASNLRSGAYQVNSGVNQLISNTAATTSNLAIAQNYLADPNSTISDSGSPFYGMTKLQAASYIIGNILQTAQSPESQQQISALEAGMSNLTSGSDSLSQGANNLSSALNTQVQPGSSQLLSGLEQLRSGSDALTQGADDTLSGSKSLSSGLSQVSSGSNNLNTGISSAQTGAEELGKQLSKGAKEALQSSNISLTSELSPMMSNPVTLEDQSINKVPNYGTGFAPYFVPLALWVGSLVLFLLIKIEKKTDTKPGKYLLSKFLTLAKIGTFQAVLLGIILILLLGLRPVNYIAFFCFSILISWCFLAILEFLVAVLQDGGKFIGIVLLMLQLTSAGGTYPVQTSPKFFQIINPYLPMTYAVKGLREIISGGNSHNIIIMFVAIALFLLGFLAIILISSRKALNSKINFSV